MDQHPGARPTERMASVYRLKFSALSKEHRLLKVLEGGKREIVSTHPDFTSAFKAGQAAVHANLEHAYYLTNIHNQRVTTFARSRRESSLLSLRARNRGDLAWLSTACTPTTR